MSTIIAEKIEILKLAKGILEGAEGLYKASEVIKQECDDLGITFKDSAFQKVYNAMEIATTGFKVVRPDLERTSDTLVNYANSL